MAFKSSTPDPGVLWVDTKGSCLLCYRQCSKKRKNSESHIRLDISIKFCKLIFRHLNMELQERSLLSNLRKRKRKINNQNNQNQPEKIAIELCEDCCVLANSFCEIYSDMELLQMRLTSCVRGIFEIMKVAGRIPSRVRAYQERMGLKTADDNVPGNSSISSKKTALVAENLRKELIQKALENLNSTSPRVRLVRRRSELTNATSSSPLLQKSPGTKTASPEAKTKPTMSEIFKLKAFIIAYAITYSCVSHLASLKASQIVPKESLELEKGEKHNDTLALVDTLNVTKSKEVNSVTPISNATDQLDATFEDPIEICQTTSSPSPLSKKRQRHSITIVDSGKTVLLPHQIFKTDRDDFVDESIMDYDDVCDRMDMVLDESISNFNESAESMLDMNSDQEPEQPLIEDNENTCRDCRLRLGSRAEVEKHRAVIHKLQAYVQCPTCKNMFDSYFALKSHRKLEVTCAIDESAEILEMETIARPIFPYAPIIRGNKFCPLEGCFEVFHSDETLNLHLKAHGSYNCQFCSIPFEKAHDLALHECRQHSEGNSGYKCSRCEFHVAGQSDFTLHFLNTHLNISVFGDRCKICLMGFLRTSSTAKDADLKDYHFKTHHDTTEKGPDSVHKCTLCDAHFLKKTQLSKHQMYIHHVASERKHFCTICGMEMLTLMLLKRHKLTVHDNIPEHEVDALLKRKNTSNGPRSRKFICPCGNTFTNNYSLVRHSKIHEEIVKEMEKQNPDPC